MTCWNYRASLYWHGGIGFTITVYNQVDTCSIHGMVMPMRLSSDHGYAMPMVLISWWHWQQPKQHGFQHNLSVYYFILHSLWIIEVQRYCLGYIVCTYLVQHIGPSLEMEQQVMKPSSRLLFDGLSARNIWSRDWIRTELTAKRFQVPDQCWWDGGVYNILFHLNKQSRIYGETYLIKWINYLFMETILIN